MDPKVMELFVLEMTRKDEELKHVIEELYRTSPFINEALSRYQESERKP